MATRKSKKTVSVVKAAAAPAAPVFTPRVYVNGNRHTTIAVYRDDDEVIYHIPFGEEFHIRRSSFTDFRGQYRPTDYPVGLAAYRFINPVLGGTPIIGTSARIILEIVMKTYLVNVKTGKFIGSFKDADGAAAAGVKGAVAVDSIEQLTAMSNKELQSLSLLIGGKTKVTDEEKEATAKAIWAAIKKAKAEPAADKSAKGKAKNGDSKMEKAYAIFTKQYGKAQRGDIIQSFKDDAKLTEGGAPTYYYLCIKRMTTECKAAGKPMPEGVAKPKAEKKAKPAKAAEGNGKAAVAAKAPKGGKKGAKAAAKKGAARKVAKAKAAAPAADAEAAAE